MLRCKAVQKCSAVCLLHKEINNEQIEKQLERSSGLLKYIPEALPTLYSYDNMCAYGAQEYYFLFAHI